MADLAEIAQSGIDPISGSPLSAERRKELFRRSQISSSGIFGGGRGGALVPVNRDPDPETLAIVRTNSNAISSLQQQINGLVKQNNSLLSSFGKINGGLQQQINLLQVNVVDLGNNLQQIANLIINDSAVERQKERLSQEQEKKLAEAGIRQGKEKQLESKIREALMWPIKRIGNKVESAFKSLINFMWQLLGGWLTIQGLDTLKALANGNKKKLEDIKNNVINSLLVVGGILGVLSLGIFRVIGTITKLTFRLGKFIVSNTIGRLFSGLWNLGKKVLGLEAKTAAKAMPTGAARVTMGAGTADDIAKTAKPAASGGNWLSKLFGRGSGKAGQAVAGKAASRIVGGAVPGIGSLVNLWSAIESAKEGNMLGASLYGTASVTSLIPPLAWLTMATTATAIGSDLTYKKSDNAKSMPTDKMMPPKPKSLGSPPPSIETTSEQTSPSTSNNEMPTNAKTSSLLPSSQITSAQVQNVPSTPTNIPPEPEPKPNIVYASSGGSNAQSSQPPMSSGSGTDVPLFPSADPDNFYALYSQVSYNVIM